MTIQLVFLSGKRTPFGKFGGKLMDFSPSELGTIAAKAALEQSGASVQDVDHVIAAHILNASADGSYVPRHVGLKVGLPQSVPALGINRLCGSGFQTVVEAMGQMNAGDTKTALLFGVEVMSQVPFALRNARWGHRMGHKEVGDMLMETLTDTYVKAPMAITAENLAVKFEITRRACDDFAIRSQNLYEKSLKASAQSKELQCVELRDRKGNVEKFLNDEHPRADTTLESLSGLKPVFKKDGVVTAGNASGIVDGACAMVVMESQLCQSRGLKPLAKLVSWGTAGCDPAHMGIGPVPAIELALKKSGLSISQMDLVEVNEAFAAQALSVQRALKIPEEKFNVNGGAIAFGHPIGATGLKILMNMIYELRARNGRYGVASACIGGGQGIALIVEACHE